MAPQKSRRSQARKVGQNVRKPKTKRVFTYSQSENKEAPSISTNIEESPSSPTSLLDTRPRFLYSISLNNLVRLDWEHRQELLPHGPGATKLEHLGFKGRIYDIESLEPVASGNKFVYLHPEKRYYVVPIYEEGQPHDTPQRFLLVRNQDSILDVGPHICVIGPSDASPNNEPFAYLHIIGGEDENLWTSPLSVTMGVVEAVLTATTPETSVFPSSAPLDEDLLSCIDVLAIAQSSRPNAAKDFDAAHNKFLEYVQKHYGLDNIPIIIGQTQFDPTLGHSAATIANNPALPDDVIVSVLRDGYRRDQKVVREAYVVVNKRDARASVIPSHSAMQTVPPLPPEQSSPDGSVQPGYSPIEELLLSIDALSVNQSGVAESDNSLEAARQKLLAFLRQNYQLEVIPITLHKTIFDPMLGHYAIGTSYNPAAPDGVITRVTKEGYTHNGAVVREAHVVVNRATALRKIETIPSGHYLRLEVATPPFASLGYFSERAIESLQAVDAIYSIMAVIRFGNAETIRQLTTSLKHSPDWFDNPVNAQKFLTAVSIEPLRILSLHYGSPIEIIWKVIESAKDLPKHIVNLIDNYRRREHIVVTDKYDEWGRRNQNMESDLELIEKILALKEKLRNAELTIEEYAIIYRVLYKQLKRISFTPDFLEQDPTTVYP
jgi:molecular chaperone GrpE (heat shock protein)